MATTVIPSIMSTNRGSSVASNDEVYLRSIAHRYISTDDSEILDHPMKHASLVAEPRAVGRLGPSTTITKGAGAR